MSDTLKIVRYEMQNVLRNRWVLAYAVFFLIVTDLLLRLGGTGPRALLGLFNVVVLLIPLVTIVFGTIYWHSSREFTELLLAQPVQRSALFHGLFAGLVLPLSAAFVVGVSLPIVMHRAINAETAPALAMMLAAGVALTVVFGAFAVLIGGLVEERLRGLGVALGVWLLLAVAYDGVVLAIALALGDRPIEGVMLGLMFFNPVDLARVFLVLHFDSASLMGYTGAVMYRALGSSSGAAIALAGLALWAAVPALLALRTFRTRDF